VRRRAEPSIVAPELRDPWRGCDAGRGPPPV